MIGKSAASWQQVGNGAAEAAGDEKRSSGGQKRAFRTLSFCSFCFDVSSFPPCFYVIPTLSLPFSVFSAFLLPGKAHEEDYVPPVTVMQKIDSNHKKLMKGDDKFYMLSINPSQDEAAHLIRKVTGKQVTEFEQLTVEEQEKVIHELKNYSRNCMDLYAENFRREKIKSGKDLVYFGRVETERHYRNSDEEVKEGQAKSGDRKPGLQLHVHIIVSRNDVTQTVRLSPLARSKGSFNELNGKKVMVGFEHMEWKSRCADRFISMYGYKATHKYYEDGREHTYHYVPGKNEAMSMAKSAILQKEFRNERKMLDVSYRMFRFMVNPKQALIAEAKRLVKDTLTGKI